MRTATIFGILAILTIPVMASAEVVVVDTFYDGPPWTLLDSGTQTDFGPANRIIGGQRDTAFTVVAGTPSLTHGIDPEGGGWIDYWSSEHGGQATWCLEYGTGGDLNANMLYDVRDLFSVKIYYKNIPDPVPLTVTVISNRGTPNETTRTLTKDITWVGGAFLFDRFPDLNLFEIAEFPYSEFEGLDFSDVDYLKFSFDGSDPSLNGLDFISGQIVNCPEPGMLSLVALGGLALIRRRR